MAVRILHCGNSIVNYNICIKEKVAGFSKRVAQIGDLIYLAVKYEGSTFCGARGLIEEVTDYKPWEDPELYIQAYSLKNIEYCEPFELNVLSSVGGKYWGVKYTQSSKAIKDPSATEILEKMFSTKQSSILYEFTIETSNEIDETEEPHSSLTEDEIDIMGTFLTVKFHSEQHKVKGLETLVNKNFYHLFEEFTQERTLLISDNRKFSTSTLENKLTNKTVNGISGIPDALLVLFNQKNNVPIQVNLIEYECYGEKKVKAMEKFNYLNGHIIPQLMRFASAFSIVTDNRLRESTIKTWVDKIIEHIYDSPEESQKVSSWIRELFPGINEQKISLELHKILVQAFNSNLRIILIIDELTSEQKDTLKNVINSFKLGSEKHIDFLGYVVRLEQRINIIDNGSEYALSIQK